MKSITINAMVGLLMYALAGYALPTNAKSAITEASATGKFLCLIFYEAQDASLTGLSSSIAAFRKSSAKKMTIYKAKMSDPATQEIAGKYGIQGGGDLPLLLIFAPNGVITGGFPKKVTSDQLKQSVGISDLMLKILKPLQEQKVALVALQNPATRSNAESWSGVNDFASDAKYAQFVTAFKADPAAAESQEFVKQCGLISPLTQATVVVLVPPGRIGKVLTGKVVKNDILAALQSCAGGSCKPGACSDRRFKQNVTPIAAALDKVSKLQGVNFTWDRATYPKRFFSEGKQMGLIAQDVESVIPEVVLTDGEGYKSVAYDKLTAVLIEAMKEMKLRISAQDSLIKVQNARIRALETKK